MSGRGSLDPRYNSTRWRTLSRFILTCDPRCKGPCEGANPSWVADHIVAVKEGGSFWDENNLRGLCEPCHRLKSRQEQGARGELHGGVRQVKRLVRGVDGTTGIPLGGWW